MSKIDDLEQQETWQGWRHKPVRTDSHLSRAERIELGIPRCVYAPSAVFSANRDRYCQMNALNQAGWWRRNFAEYGGSYGLGWAKDELARASEYRAWAEEGGFKLP